MLRVAVPNKGALAEPAASMLRDSGYRQRTDARDLSVTDEGNDVTFFYLRPKDIATYVADGSLHLGITGQDLIRESGITVKQRLELGFGRSRLCFAVPRDKDWEVEDLAGKRIATSYPQLVRGHLASNGIRAKDVIRLDGAVEISVQLGVAEAIADVVGSGRTLEQHGLKAIGIPIVKESQAVLVERVPKQGEDPEPPEVRVEKERFAGRVRGVLLAREHLMLDYDCPRHALDDAKKITPGLQSPTVARLLDDPDWVAVRAMVERKGVNQVMDELAALGCRAVLASDIRSLRAIEKNGDADRP